MQIISDKVKKINIEIPKQNYMIIPFAVTRDGEKIKLDDDDLIFMTVKSSYKNEEYKFQKSLNNGITYNEDTKSYDIEINSNDTKDLIMNHDYEYDITIYYGGNKPKQKVVGLFKVGKKYTLNEVEQWTRL